MKLWIFWGESKTREFDLIFISLDANFFPYVSKEGLAQILVHCSFFIYVNLPTPRKYQVVNTRIDGRSVKFLGF